MADFGGFQITTPTEVATDQDMFRKKAFTSGNAQVMRSANVESALDTIAGNSAMNLARKTQSRIQAAQQAAGAQQQQGENDLDYNIRKLQGIRDSIVDIDPAAASQINTQLLKFGEMKFQRGLLTAQNTRAQEEFDLQKPALQAKAAESRIASQAYVIDTTDNAPGAQFKAEQFNLADPKQTADFEAARKKPGTMTVTGAQAVELYKDNSDNAVKLREAMAKASSNGVGKNTWNQLAQTGAGIIGLYDTTDRLFNILKQNPDALSAASTGAKELDKFTSQLAAAARVANGATTTDGTNIDTWMKANNVTNSRMQSMVISLAFAIAKAQNGTGRITDRDLIAAKTTLGGDNPNPAVITSNLNDMLTASTSSMNDQIGYLDSDGTAPTFVRAMQKSIQAKQSNYIKNHGDYIKGAYGIASGSPAAAGKSPLESRIDAILGGK